jgi:glucokinase
MILAGDIGGTKSWLSLSCVEQKQCRLSAEKAFHSKDYPSLETILREFLRGQEKIASACFGVPGPVVGGIVKTTNLPWVIDTQSIQKELSTRNVEIINDLVANAYGIFTLKKRDLVTLNAGKIKRGNVALLSAGTGLGEAILFWNGKQHVPSPSEGGHIEFGPKNNLEIELTQYLLDRFGHVSYERVLSGAGLLHIYQFLKDSKRFGREPAWLAQKIERDDPAAVISETAQQGKSKLCRTAVDMFVSIYGSAAGSLALQAMAVGGIYIGGGIAPKIVWKLKDGTFMNAFKNKGRLSKIVVPIPVKVIVNDKAALLGAAYHAMELLDEG